MPSPGSAVKMLHFVLTIESSRMSLLDLPVTELKRHVSTCPAPEIDCRHASNEGQLKKKPIIGGVQVLAGDVSALWRVRLHTEISDDF